MYSRVEYAANTFKTREYQEKHPTKHDDSHFSCDYIDNVHPPSDTDTDDDDDESKRKRGFATLTRIVVHEMYPGGPKRTFLEGDWYTEVTRLSPCPVAGTPVVKLDPEQKNFFNYQAKFVLLENCYEKPIAIWPHDPINHLPANQGLFDVIDLNQDQQIAT